MLLSGDPLKQSVDGLEAEVKTPGTSAYRYFNRALDRMEQKEEEKYHTKKEKGGKKDEKSSLLYRLFEKWDALWEPRRRKKDPESVWTGGEPANIDERMKYNFYRMAEEGRKENSFLFFKECLHTLAGLALIGFAVWLWLKVT